MIVGRKGEQVALNLKAVGVPQRDSCYEVAIQVAGQCLNSG